LGTVDELRERQAWSPAGAAASPDRDVDDDIGRNAGSLAASGEVACVLVDPPPMKSRSSSAGSSRAEFDFETLAVVMQIF
jgi:hypothetical protein